MDTEDKKRKTESIDWDFIIIATMGMIATIIIFENSKYGYKLDLEDYFQFVASIGGAILGAIVSFKILNITIINQKEDFEAQRRIEESRWETTVNQFNIQIKIQGINDKINDFNIFVKSINNIVKSIEELQEELEKYSDKILIFDKEVEEYRNKKLLSDMMRYMNVENLKKDDNKCLNIDAFNLEEVSGAFNLFIRLEGEMMIKAQCFKEKNIIDLYKIISCKINESHKHYEKMIRYKRYSTKYSDYVDDELYKELSDNIFGYKNNCWEYTKELSNIKLKLIELEVEVREEIGKLYNKKYDLTGI